MESFPQFLQILGLLLCVVIYVYSFKRNIKKGTKLVPPEPPGALPFVGHLHRLRGQGQFARILGSMADVYGPIYSLRLGTHRAVVVSSWQMVKECLTTHDKNFAHRPNMAASRYFGYDGAVFTLARYGPCWRETRKLATTELFTRLDKLKNVINSEMQYLMKDLSMSVKNEEQTSTVNMTKWFEHITLNINVKMVAGKRFSCLSSTEGGNDDSQVKEAIKKALYLMGVLLVSDVIPNLEWLDIGGHVKAMKQVGKELDGFIGKWLDEHTKKRKEDHSDKEADFMDAMLSVVSKDAEMLGHGRETIIKATALTIILGGSEITAEALTWALSLLLNNPNILKAAQSELDINVGRERWVEESDIKNLRYMQAIVKETLRMYPPGPLAGPHEAIEDCSVGGYHISKGTRLILNIRKLHRDTQVWSDPHSFQPERFLEEHSNINYQGQNFEYIPFGSGRRMCPGNVFAMQVVHLTLARLLQGFDLSTPMGKPVDMTEGVGIALPKVNPLEVILTPRLSPKLY